MSEIVSLWRRRHTEKGNHTICLISAYEIFLLLYDGKPESYQDFRESMVAIQYWRLDPGTPEK